MLEDTLRNNKLMDSPSCMFNYDETGLPLNPSSFKVVALKGSKNVSNITSNSKSQITVLAYTSAAGYAIPPFIVFGCNTYHPHLSRGEVPGTMYGMTPMGWMTQTLFFEWFKKHFLRYIPSIRPVLLLLDGHSSHYCPEFVKLAANEKVVAFVLPPHTSHLSQPLDRGCFSPLKSYWKQACHKFHTVNKRNITSYDFVSLFSKAWSSAMTLKNIVASFRVTGVYPFDRSAIKLPEEEVYKDFRPENLCKKSGLAYIPLYSPSCHTVVKKPLMKDDSSATSSGSSDEKIVDDDCIVYLRTSLSAISIFLGTPMPLSKIPTKLINPAGGVITSADYINEMEKKRALKEEEEEEKKRRKKRERGKRRGVCCLRST